MVRAEDGGSPPLTSDNNATLTINIIRNNNPPQWQNLPYAETISQTNAVGSQVANVFATDVDQIFSVVRYEIIGDGDAPAYFRIADPLQGRITVASSLTNSPDLVFYVSTLNAFDFSLFLFHKNIKNGVSSICISLLKVKNNLSSFDSK